MCSDLWTDDLSNLTCPYCNYLNDFSDAIFLYSEEENTLECDECKKEFTCIGTIEWSWTTMEKENNE